MAGTISWCGRYADRDVDRERERDRDTDTNAHRDRDIGTERQGQRHA